MILDNDDGGTSEFAMICLQAGAILFIQIFNLPAVANCISTSFPEFVSFNEYSVSSSRIGLPVQTQTAYGATGYG
jgi:hypothetical protein